uniref:Methyltransferase domain-containing protein n=1 Tax=Odontella aurita TaxID=265563 RepID=A0A7S4I431_9STRA|mmetsp:Transcript_19636/g.57108  ORF Transcript_19636/g.57108 Transcript_19636/m.57108 type:complete len:340 (+) Transcript_19636:241-1260(+)
MHTDAPERGTGTAEQKKSSIEFWDNHHSNEQEEAKEWILTVSPNLLRLISSHIPIMWDGASDGSTDIDPTMRTVRILEIGCGTSALSRSLLDYLVSGRRKGNDVNRISVTATDVSSVCIEKNRARDASFASSLSHDELQYDTLDTLGESLLLGDIRGRDATSPGYDIIVDKGCLDTFLFRNVRKCKTTEHHPPLLSRLLINVHRMLSRDGKYMVISPRRKIPSLRDFSGFGKVERTPVDAIMDDLADLEGVSNQKSARCLSAAAYMYVCEKDSEFVFCSSPLFRVRADMSLPDDAATCAECGISFLKFRAGENIDPKGQRFWTRKWRGHAVHCGGKATT